MITSSQTRAPHALSSPLPSGTPDGSSRQCCSDRELRGAAGARSAPRRLRSKRSLPVKSTVRKYEEHWKGGLMHRGDRANDQCRRPRAFTLFSASGFCTACRATNRAATFMTFIRKVNKKTSFQRCSLSHHSSVSKRVDPSFRAHMSEIICSVLPIPISSANTYPQR